MNKYLKYVMIMAVLVVSACQKESGNDDFFLVEVVGKGEDCAGTYLIKFQEKDVEKVKTYLKNTDVYFPVFYAGNLPEKFKVAGSILKVKLQENNSGEVHFCRLADTVSGHVYIESAETVSLALPWMFF